MSSGFHRLGANSGKLKGWSNSGTAYPPGMTDMMVSPESLGAFLEANPIPSVDPAGFEPVPDKRAMARASGYTGDECQTCGSVRMRNNGTCKVCDDCGSSSGCS